MFKSKTERFFLVGIILVVVLIPVVSFILSQRLKVSSPTKNLDRTITKVAPNPTTDSSLSDLRKTLGLDGNTPSTTPSNSSSEPGMSLSIAIQGRPDTDQHTKLFIGIAQGQLVDTPQYLLTYTVDVPASGTYSGVSLTGLTQGTTYTAYLKGTTQLVKAVTFVMNPAGVNLNAGNPIPLITGDLNSDNVIDQADYNIVKNLLGTTSSSSNWNATADFNLDNVINSLDLAIVQGNLGKVGDSGKWYSSVSGPASSSASIQKTPSIGGGPGYWMWVPPGN